MAGTAAVVSAISGVAAVKESRDARKDAKKQAEKDAAKQEASTPPSSMDVTRRIANERLYAAKKAGGRSGTVLNKSRTLG